MDSVLDGQSGITSQVKQENSSSSQCIPKDVVVKVIETITDPAKQVGPAGLPNRYHEIHTNRHNIQYTVYANAKHTHNNHKQYIHIHTRTVFTKKTNRHIHKQLHPHKHIPSHEL